MVGEESLKIKSVQRHMGVGLREGAAHTSEYGIYCNLYVLEMPSMREKAISDQKIILYFIQYKFYDRVGRMFGIEGNFCGRRMQNENYEI